MKKNEKKNEYKREKKKKEKDEGKENYCFSIYYIPSNGCNKLQTK